MDISKYAAKEFIKFEDIAHGPRRETIVDVAPGGYEKLTLEFESGAQFSLNGTNTLTLKRAYGAESDNWLGATIELYPGQIKYKGEPQDSVLVRPISPPRAQDVPAPAKKPRRDEMNDDVPF